MFVVREQSKDECGVDEVKNEVDSDWIDKAFEVDAVVGW